MDSLYSQITTTLDLRGVTFITALANDSRVKDHIITGGGFTIQIHPEGQYIVYQDKPVKSLSALLLAMLENGHIPEDAGTTRIPEIEIGNVEGVRCWFQQLQAQGLFFSPDDSPIDILDDGGNPLFSIKECISLEQELNIATLICLKHDVDVCKIASEFEHTE